VAHFEWEIFVLLFMVFYGVFSGLIIGFFHENRATWPLLLNHISWSPVDLRNRVIILFDLFCKIGFEMDLITRRNLSACCLVVC